MTIPEIAANDSKRPSGPEEIQHKKGVEDKGQLNGLEIKRILQPNQNLMNFVNEFPLLSTAFAVGAFLLAFTCIFSFSLTSIVAGVLLGVVATILTKAIYDHIKQNYDYNPLGDKFILSFPQRILGEFGQMVGIYLSKPAPENGGVKA